MPGRWPKRYRLTSGPAGPTQGVWITRRCVAGVGKVTRRRGRHRRGDHREMGGECRRFRLVGPISRGSRVGWPRASQRVTRGGDRNLRRCARRAPWPGRRPVYVDVCRRGRGRGQSPERCIPPPSPRSQTGMQGYCTPSDTGSASLAAFSPRAMWPADDRSVPRDVRWDRDLDQIPTRLGRAVSPGARRQSPSARSAAVIVMGSCPGMRIVTAVPSHWGRHSARASSHLAAHHLALVLRPRPAGTGRKATPAVRRRARRRGGRRG